MNNQIQKLTDIHNGILHAAGEGNIAVSGFLTMLRHHIDDLKAEDPPKSIYTDRPMGFIQTRGVITTDAT